MVETLKQRNNPLCKIDTQAEIVGCTRRMFGMYIAENNPHSIPLAKLQALASAFSVNPDWLCGLSDIRSKHDASISTLSLVSDRWDALDALLDSIGIRFTASEADGYLWDVAIDSRTPSQKYMDEANNTDKETFSGTMTTEERSSYEIFILDSIITETQKYISFCERHRFDMLRESARKAEK